MCVCVEGVVSMNHNMVVRRMADIHGEVSWDDAICRNTIHE